MAKERILSTKFWNDNWVRKINPLDRYLFLYLLSNEHTNICGIYELPISTIAYETGLDERDLEKVMLPRMEPKAYYKDGWVILPNFPRHQHTESPKVQSGIQRELEALPSHIYEYAIRYGYPIHRVAYTKLNLTKPNSFTPDGVKKEESEEEIREDINPSTPSLGDWIIHEGYNEVEMYGGEEVGETIGYSHSSRKKPYSREELEKRYEAYLKSLVPKKRKPLEHFDFEECLQKLRDSHQKVDKIIALCWFRKGYQFDNYAQWQAQFGQDVRYAKMLEGYSGEDISRAIELCEQDAEKQGYDWKVSTVVKKIAEVKKKNN